MLIADPDPHARERIRSMVSILGRQAVCVATGLAALAAARDEDVALALVSVELAGPCGFEVLHRWRTAGEHNFPVALLSSSDGQQPRDEVASLLLGADDYFTKPLEPDLFLARARRLIDRGRGVQQHDRPAGAGLALTTREREVLTLLAAGRRSSEIAQDLCISRKTASTHVARILAKLGVHSQAQAVAYALREQIVSVPAPELQRCGADAAGPG